MSSPKHILFLGLGSLGSRVLDMFLASAHGHKATVGSRRVEAANERVNLSCLVGLSLGFEHDVDVVHVDLNNVEQTTHTLQRLKPDVIFSAVSLQSWWVISELPPEDFRALDAAQFGPWLPMHLTLVRNLMLAVRAAGLDSIVINCSFPDAVNPILKSVGLQPTVGIGNVANTIPALRIAAASQLNCAVSAVTVRVTAAHYVSHRLPRHGDTGDAPFHLRVDVGDVDVTRRLDVPKLLKFVATRLRRTTGKTGQSLTAASAISILRAVADDTGAMCHAPGPLGLPGGYPVNVSSSTVSLALPQDLEVQEAIRINQDGLRFDGIDRIHSDGRVEFTASSAEIMKRLLGYSCASMSVADSGTCAAELGERYAAFARKCGVRRYIGA